jgi:spoIIIJ-associated protein
VVAESLASSEHTGDDQSDEGQEILAAIGAAKESGQRTSGREPRTSLMAPELIKNGQLDRAAATAALQEFLENTLRAGGFQLKVTTRAVVGDPEGDAEVIADLDGRDKELLLERGAEVLKALEHLAFRALRIEPAFHEKIHLDCGGYRALRFEELRMTARVAAERVQTSKQPFRLNPMSSRERRIVHLALKDVPGIRTESIGVGDQRQVVIHPAGSGADKAAK